MVIEAYIEEDDKTTKQFSEQKVKAYSVAGWAYQIFVRSMSDGTLYALPDPETMPHFTGKCRRPMCMGSLHEAPKQN